jgi:hypothetical protein
MKPNPDGIKYEAKSPVSQIVTPLIPSDAQERIERVVRQANVPLREHIRSETALKLSDGTQKLSIPVKVREGFTGPFGDIITRYPDPLLWWLICGRRELAGIVEGTSWLLSRWPQLENWDRLPPVPPNAGDSISVTRDVAKALQELVRKPVIIEEISKITEDYLGCYFFPQGHSPWIEIYWMPIALTAAMIDVRMEDLAVVTLAHELSHGYTHIGLDIDGVSWPSPGFGASDDRVVEGLAQFYTDIATARIEARHPGAHEAYERFLKIQSGPYRAHEDWLKGSPEQRRETVRFSMLSARTLGKIGHVEWTELLDETKEKLRRKPTKPKPSLFVE